MRAFATVLWAGALSATGASAGADIELASYRGVYDLALANGSEVAGFSSLTGRMVAEFTGSRCAGYTAKLRFVTRSDADDGNSEVMDSRSSTFETADGSRLDFSSETYSDETLVEESKGSARRTSEGITVSLTKPSTKKLGLSRGVVFPTDQLAKIISAAIAGERFIKLDVYDGSESGETIFETAAVIGPVSTDTADVGDETPIRDAGIGGLRHWPLTVSYFEKGKGSDDTPSYTMAFVIYENGIARDLSIDYGDFTIAGSLTKLDLLTPTPCP
jgi:hypothetical protein